MDHERRVKCRTIITGYVPCCTTGLSIRSETASRVMHDHILFVEVMKLASVNKPGKSNSI